MSKTRIATTTLLTLAAAATLATPSSAREQWRYEIEKRQARHNELIIQGRENGMLTWREARRLKVEQFRIARMKHQFLTDGDLDGTERQALRYAQDAANAHIFEARNNADRRRWW